MVLNILETTDIPADELSLVLCSKFKSVDICSVLLKNLHPDIIHEKVRIGSSKLPVHQFFELLKILPQKAPLSLVDISAAASSLAQVMRNPITTTIFEGKELAKKCDLVCYFVDLLKAIPAKQALLQHVGTRTVAANKKIGIETPDKFDPFSQRMLTISTMENPSAADREKSKTELFEAKKQAFLALSQEITGNVLGIIERIIMEITACLVPSVDKLLIPQLLEKVIPSLTVDANIFINNPGGISTSQLNATREFRGEGSQICTTRKYTNVELEFKKYIQACIRKLTPDDFTPIIIKASNPEYDVLIKAVVSKETGLLYLSTFFPGIG